MERVGCKGVEVKAALLCLVELWTSFFFVYVLVVVCYYLASVSTRCVRSVELRILLFRFLIRNNFFVLCR